MWWLDDILHEIGTVALGAFFVFVLGAVFGACLQGKISALALRRIILAFGTLCALFLFFMFVPDELELWIVSEIFLFSFVWGVITSFEKRWIWKELFLRDFWFPKNGKASFYKLTRLFPEGKRNGG